MKAVPIQKTILAVNNFIVNTTVFLNNFSSDCEGKFMKISSRITDLETLLMIFEAKLNSINIAENTVNRGKSNMDPGSGSVDALSSSHSEESSGVSGRITGNGAVDHTAHSVGQDGHGPSAPSGGHIGNIHASALRPPPPPPPPPAPPIAAPSSSSSTSAALGSPRGDSKGTDEEEPGGEGGGVEGGGGGGGGRVKAKEHPEYIGYFKMLKVMHLQYSSLFFFSSMCIILRAWPYRGLQ